MSSEGPIAHSCGDPERRLLSKRMHHIKVKTDFMCTLRNATINHPDSSSE